MKSESSKPKIVLDAKPLIKLLHMKVVTRFRRFCLGVEAGDLEAAINVVTLTEIYYKYMKKKEQIWLKKERISLCAPCIFMEIPLVLRVLLPLYAHAITSFFPEYIGCLLYTSDAADE